MSHHHDASTTWRLMATMILNFLITITELIGGFLSGSLSLVSDALHNFSDGVAVILSYVALRLKRKDVNERHTFGLKRAEIFAATINAGVLVVITLYLFYKSVVRIIDPEQISGSTMMLVAGIGLFANVIGTGLLVKPAKESMNLRSAYLHLFSDAISSLGVILGGIAIHFWNLYWLDPILTILIGIYILRESYQILGESIHILMEGAPLHLSIEEIRQAVEAIPQVQDFHHVHIWMVGENDVHIEGHVNVSDMLISESGQLRNRIETLLEEKFGIHHITLQFECNHCQNPKLIEG